MTIRPHKDHEINPDTEIMYQAMVQKNKKDRAEIHELVQRKRVRQAAEEEMRESWDRLTEQERIARVKKLEEVCNELIKYHTDYKSFKKAVVIWPVEDEKQELCIIHWNGKKSSKQDGWGLIDREFPASDVAIVSKRYQDRLRLFKSSN